MTFSKLAPWIIGAITVGAGAWNNAQETSTEKATLQVGQPAPSFRLNDHEGNARAVGGESGAYTVIAFFPKASTPG